jgi:hypothetical protein
MFILLLVAQSASRFEVSSLLQVASCGELT